MADDPLDQTSKDDGRPRHEPPTIDLEASEVSGETHAAAATGSRRASLAGLLLPLLSGAIAALAVFAALWTGLVGTEPPAPPPSVTAADHAALAEKVNVLSARMTRLESRPQPQPAVSAPQPPAIDPARLSAAEKAVASLREDVAALRSELDRRPAGSGPNATPAADAAPEIAALKDRLTRLEQSPRIETPAPQAAPDDLLLRRAVIASALSAQVQRGAPFASLLTAAKQTAITADVLAPLDAFAASGVPDDARLSRDLLALLPQLSPRPDTAKPQQSSARSGLFDRLQANAAKLVHVERADAGRDSDAPLSALALVEAAAKRSDVAAARREISQLPPPARAAAKPWIDAVDAREAARATASQFAGDAVTALAKASR